MSDEKKKFPNLPPGFSEDDFIPINIKSVKENEQGFEIEIKPNREKEEGAKYQYKLKNGVYHILRNGKAVYTPNRTKVTVVNEALAQRTAEHLNVYGEEYESPYSIVNFVYSHIEFFDKMTKEELENPVLNDSNGDWILRIDEFDIEKFKEWFPDYGYEKGYGKKFNTWLKKLTKFQTGAVIILGASLSSVNTAYLLSNVWKKENLEELALEYFNIWDNYREMVDPDFNMFWRPNDLEKIFENYLFWQELGI
jgi:hypothetical protein